MMDVLQAAIDLLKADAGVQALVSDGLPVPSYYVFGQELPDGMVSLMPRHAVVLRRVPGLGGAKGTVRLEEGVLAAASYGETFKDAEQLRGAVRDCLRAMTRPSARRFSTVSSRRRLRRRSGSRTRNGR
jgi:hypothetical protein